MKEFIGKFFGPQKIAEATLSSEKTYTGKDKVQLKFDSEEKITIPLEVAKEILKDQSIDLSELREQRVKPIVEKMLVVLLESELKKEDMEYLMNTKLPLSINQSLNRAQEKLWGKQSHEITLLDVERVLMGNKEKKAKLAE